MDRTALKNYAPKARREFIQAVTDRAAFYGLTAKRTEPVVEKGNVAIIGGRAFPRSIIRQRLALEERIGRQSFDQVMEAMAYIWFNRFVALRYMELHQYLEHGYRVLSHPEGKTTPEIVEHAEHLDLPGLDKDKVIELKLDGTKETELYRLLLVAQCNALHEAMPFLFERIDDETELLLPDNLLHSDSVIRKLVNEIEEEDWKEVEIIGWIYQFYISEKKDQVIGKVVKSEDIPAATQLFTPNWIVKYLVQNTLGRQWLATYPDSPIRKQMEYYIEPAEQTEEVKAQLKAITPESLNPEELTLLDPDCGSGHILVESYDVFKAIYQERGYRSRDIPRIILQKNLYGLEIDDRAAQLAAFALLMKARADDRSVFADRIQPNVLAIQESQGLEKLLRPDAADVTATGQPLVTDQDLFPDAKKQLPLKKQPQESPLAAVEPCLRELIKLFKHGKTFGSLIRVPPEVAAQVHTARQSIDLMIAKQELWEHRAATLLLPLLEQAELLGKTYDAVVTNPPYMGTKGMNLSLKEFGGAEYPNSKSDLFAIFSERVLGMVKPNAFVGLMTPFTWMFLKSYAHLRKRFVQENTITSLIQPEYHAFFESAYVPICAFVVHRSNVKRKSEFIGLSAFYGEDLQPVKALEAIHNPRCGWRYSVYTGDFSKIPGSPIAYWTTDKVRDAFAKGVPLRELAEPGQGIATADNNRFLRLWYEVSTSQIAFGCTSRRAAADTRKKWVPYNKGGEYRKWFGNQEWLVNWEEDGRDILANRPKSVVRNPHSFFQPSASWSKVTSGAFALRLFPAGFIYDVAGCSMFSQDEETLLLLMSLLNSTMVKPLLSDLAPTLNFEVGQVSEVPVIADWRSRVADVVPTVRECVSIAEADWNNFETRWGFSCSPLVLQGASTIAGAFEGWATACQLSRSRMKELEQANNRYWIDVYGLYGVVASDISDGQITLALADQEEDIKRLISYSVGCMMGRYSLDRPGLIYSFSSNKDFDRSQYKTFPADTDGIIPVTEIAWFANDATERIVEFIATSWPREHLEVNLKFIGDSLGANKGEQPQDTIRRYLAENFFKDHMQAYKKRPIYWLFSSGKQEAFQCLVYLHRYHEGTLARMRTEYVIPLQGKITARIEQLASDIQKATSTSHRKKLEKEQDALKKQQVELQAFDEKLRHFADERISLDLDDGVKVNYGKFGDLLAEVKAVCGKSEEEE